MSNHVSIAAVGDIMLGDSFYFVGRGVRSVIEQEGHEYIFSKVKGILSKFDLVVGNLECVLSEAGLQKRRVSSFQHRGRKEFAGYLANANFSVLSVSNNHIMEHGKQPMMETVCALQVSGILAVGLPEV